MLLFLHIAASPLVSYTTETYKDQEHKKKS